MIRMYIAPNAYMVGTACVGDKLQKDFLKYDKVAVCFIGRDTVYGQTGNVQQTDGSVR